MVFFAQLEAQLPGRNDTAPGVTSRYKAERLQRPGSTLCVFRTRGLYALGPFLSYSGDAFHCACVLKVSQAHRVEKEKKAMMNERTHVLEGNEKAEELAKAGADAEGGRMAAANVLTTRRSCKDMYASIEYAAHFHV